MAQKYIGVLFTRIKTPRKQWVFSALKEDLEFKFVLFRIFCIAYSNQTRFSFTQPQRLFVIKTLCSVMLEQLSEIWFGPCFWREWLISEKAQML
jgi:hypothetical protein